MSRAEKLRRPKKVELADKAGRSWIARESSSGKFVVVEPAKKAKRFKASQLRDAVRKAGKARV